MYWEELLDEKALAALLPGEYTQFARPLKEGLVVFLGRLPESIQQSILAEQSALPTDAPVAVRLGQFARSCPVLHKLAQILARDRRLAPELREQFHELESLLPSVDLAVIEASLAKELGPLDRRGITLVPPAIAEASVAVVIPFRLLDGAETREGVFKLLKPGIEHRLELELELLGCVGSHLDDQCDELQIPQLNYRETFDLVRQKLANEVLLEQEQAHLIEARSIYENQPDVHIPAVFAEYCTSTVTAMERICGEKVTEHSLQCPWETRRLAELVSRALVAQPMFARSDRALFHSDPHAGNLLYTCDNRLAILDWSLVGRLTETHRVAMTQILLAAVTFQPEKIVNLCEHLAERGNLKFPVLRRIVDNWLRRLGREDSPGLSWLVGLLDDATQLAGLRVSGDVVLFRKSLLTLEGVVGDIGAAGHWVDDVAWRQFLWHFAAELPLRPFARPDSRQWATHLSNTDLCEVTLSFPLAAARYWLAQWSDLFQNRSSAVSSFT